MKIYSKTSLSAIKCFLLLLLITVSSWICMLLFHCRSFKGVFILFTTLINLLSVFSFFFFFLSLIFFSVFAAQQTTAKRSGLKQLWSSLMIPWSGRLFFSCLNSFMAADSQPAAQPRWPGQLVSLSMWSLSSWTSSHRGGLRVPVGQAPVHEGLLGLSLMACLLGSPLTRATQTRVCVGRGCTQGCGTSKCDSVWTLLF